MTAATGDGAAGVLPLPLRGVWFEDARDGDRALRASWHGEIGCVVLSMWRRYTCVGTTRLTPSEAARLAGSMAAALAAAVPPLAPSGGAELDLA